MPNLNPARVLTSLVPEPGPRRVYALSTLINTFGTGLIILSMTLYFTKVVHLSTAQTGLGLTIAGLIGVVTGIPIGDIADRRGPRETVRVMLVVQFVTTFCYLLIHSFAIFVLVATADLLALNATLSSDGALLRRVGGEGAAGYRATTQAISSLGLALGALGCGIAVQIDTPDAYRTLILLNALTFLAGCVVLGRLPRYEPLPKPEIGPRWVALTDMPFVAYTVLSGAMFIQYFVIILGLPLWVVDHTHAPRWSIPAFLLINTMLVILFQVRIGEKVKTIRQGGAALRRAGVVFLFSCSAIGFATGIPGWAALLVLVGAVALHTYGELWHSSASFALGFGLAPAHAQGQYMGLSGIGNGLGGAAAPVLLIGLCLSLGRVGWIGIGVCFALVSLTAPALARWGERTRPISPQDSEAPQAVTVE